MGGATRSSRSLTLRTGSVLLLAPDRNEPLGLRNAPARTSHSSLPTGIFRPVTPPVVDTKKMTKDGKIILDPQPDDSANDPLNWQAWRRDSALISLGLFCMVGGGMTPILAAGFGDVADDYGVDVPTVSLTTGLCESPLPSWIMVPPSALINHMSSEQI